MSQSFVSSVCIMVSSKPISTFVLAWNSHRIPGRSGGIPSVLTNNTNRVTHLHPSSVPSTHEAVVTHEQHTHTRLTRHSCFGRDPLAEHENLRRLRDRDFNIRYPDMQVVLTELLHGSSHLFRNAVAYHIQLTRAFSSLL